MISHTLIRSKSRTSGREAASVYPESQSVQRRRLRQHPRCFLRGFDMSVTHWLRHLLSPETPALTASSISLSASLTFCTSAWGCLQQDVAAQAISSAIPEGPLRKRHTADPGNSGSSCDETFTFPLDFFFFFHIVSPPLPQRKSRYFLLAVLFFFSS